MSAPVNDSMHLIDTLQSPAAYSHPVDEIRLLQTHISWILLTGQLAYKVKKPVDLGFVDFTTLERRRFFCHEELRLNRRLAPDLYLDVVPITGTPASPHVGGTGEPIEFAVQMRQFPQEALLSHVLEHGRLRPDHIDALAREVAEFHGRIAVAPPDGRFGTVESIWRSMEEILDHLELATEYAPPVLRLRSWCRQELLARKAEFINRRKHGFVRECHGDMHLGNMLLLNDQPLMFDCIEFNDDLRWIDVQSEVAFTAMDLEDRGSPAFAHRFLNAYLEHTGDYAGLAVLRYYLVYRALVRAKIALLRLQQADLEANQRPHLVAEYQGYLDLAERYAQPPHPALIITHGLSGSGKSTFTQPLLEASGAIRIRSDVERKRLFELNALDRSRSGLASGIYTSQASQQTYDRLADLATSVLRGGFPAIVDATFLKQEQRARLRGVADQLDVPFVILDFQASDEALRERLVRRARSGGDASEADLEVLSHQIASQEPLGPEELSCTIRVDSEEPDALASTIQQLAGLLDPTAVA